MADTRTTRSFTYAVESGYTVRSTRSFAYAVEGNAANRRVTRSHSLLVEAEGMGVGEAPVLRVGNIRQTSADLSVDPLTEYLKVRFRTFRQIVFIQDDAIQVGITRWARGLTGLIPATAYVSQARVERAVGWSPWSDPVEWMTLAEGAPIGERGCPPTPIGQLINPDANPPNFAGIGFFHPLPGEPLSGVETIVLRYNDPAWLWDIYLSDDYGATYSLLVENLGPDGEFDGDQLELYTFQLDTTLLANGMNYRLKAVSKIPGDDEEFESLTFPIDNVDDDDPEKVQYWDMRKSSTDRFGSLWAQNSRDTLFGVPDGLLWGRGYDGGLAALSNHDWAILVDRLVPLCKGGDITVRWYIWSGEGGIFALQGRDDCEGLHVGAGFFANGESTDEKSGLVAEVHNPLCWPLGCCDDVLTSSTARSNVGIPSGADSLGALDKEGGGLAQSIIEIVKMYFKAVTWPFWWPRRFRGSFPHLIWRDGAFPGDNPTVNQTCGRRWEMYCQRIRVEEDPGDATRLRVRKRLDGPGVPEPESGYWHYDEWHTLDEPLECGALGMVSQQTTQAVYANAVYGARVFLSWSAKPIDVCGENLIPPIELPPVTFPQVGQPCTLVLQVYDEDRETLSWEVGTDVNHVNPYLDLPQNYGEQEIDIINGATSITQVEVVVIDKNVTVGDQDSGWLTQRISEGGIGIIKGRRCRLIRYISVELGWIVIADGPASTPLLDESYSAYRWTIRDTRESERKVRAFANPDETWLAPVGVASPWGRYIDPADGSEKFLVEAPDVLTGTFRISNTTGVPLGFVDLTDYWPGPFGGGGFPFSAVPLGTQTIPDDVIIGPGMWPNDLGYAEIDIQGDPYPVVWTWPNIEFLWRPAGSEDAFTVIQPLDTLVEGRSYGGVDAGFPRSLITGFNALNSSGEAVIGVTFLLLEGYLSPGTFPDHLDEVEIIYRYKGPTTAQAPFHLQLDEVEEGVYENITAGQLLKRLYDGLYSPPDPITGEIVPTGIRYDEEALDQMTDVVMLRITEPVDDIRAWTEEFVYAPTGWVPALDNDGRISPVSQIPPQDNVMDINNAITEPVPNWDAGETIVNILRFNYPRYFQTGPLDAGAIDGIQFRKIEHEYIEPNSILQHNEQKVEYSGDIFGAAGDSVQRPVMGLQNELGYLLAQDRKLYVFDRYKNGAQIIQVPVMRSRHIHVPEIIEHYSAILRVGDWVTIDLSWFPDYTTRRRGMQTRGQIIAINDVDCAWRILVIEEAFPQPES